MCIRDRYPVQLHIGSDCRFGHEVVGVGSGDQDTGAAQGYCVASHVGGVRVAARDPLGYSRGAGPVYLVVQDLDRIVGIATQLDAQVLGVLDAVVHQLRRHDVRLKGYARSPWLGARDVVDVVVVDIDQVGGHGRPVAPDAYAVGPDDAGAARMLYVVYLVVVDLHRPAPAVPEPNVDADPAIQPTRGVRVSDVVDYVVVDPHFPPVSYTHLTLPTIYSV